MSLAHLPVRVLLLLLVLLGALALGGRPAGYRVEDDRVLFLAHDGGLLRQARQVFRADPGSFVPLAAGYAKDAQHVFYRARRVAEADVRSFEVIGPAHARDAGQVYYRGQPVAGADPDRFEALGGGFGRDARAVYFQARALAGADPASFRLRAGTLVGQDRHGCYRQGQRTACE